MFSSTRTLSSTHVANDDSQPATRAIRSGASPLGLSGVRFVKSLQFAGNVPSHSPETLGVPRSPTSYYNFAVSFLKANRQSDEIYWADVNALPSLIRTEMSTCPGLKISHHLTPQAFVAHAADLCRTGNDCREQCVVELDAREGHCVAVDLRIRNRLASMIVVESGMLDAVGPALMLMRLQCAVQTESTGIAPDGRNKHLLFLETHTQQSPVDCAMFSLQACKTMVRGADTFESLHDRLRSGDFVDMLHKGYVSSDECDALLPPELMKHTQSSRRLAEYEHRHLKTHPEHSATISRLARRQEGLTFAREDRTYSVSIEMARIKSAGRALTAGKDMNTPEGAFLSSTEAD